MNLLVVSYERPRRAKGRAMISSPPPQSPGSKSSASRRAGAWLGSQTDEDAGTIIDEVYAGDCRPSPRYCLRDPTHPTQAVRARSNMHMLTVRPAGGWEGGREGREGRAVCVRPADRPTRSPSR